VQRALVVDRVPPFRTGLSALIGNSHKDSNAQHEDFYVLKSQTSSSAMGDPLSVLGAAVGVTSLIIQLADECVKGLDVFEYV
jgi:hypothetical protein